MTAKTEGWDANGSPCAELPCTKKAVSTVRSVCSRCGKLGICDVPCLLAESITLDVNLLEQQHRR